MIAGSSWTHWATADSNGDRWARAGQPAAAAASGPGTSAASSSAAMLSGAKNRIRWAIVVRPSWSSHPQNALLKSGHVRDEPGVLGGRHRAVPGRDEGLADVAHHDGQDRVVAGGAGQVHRDHGVIDEAWRLVHEAGPPDQVRAVHVVAGDPHDPVGGRAELLDEERLRAHRDPLEDRPGPRVGGFHPGPGRRPGQQLPG